MILHLYCHIRALYKREAFLYEMYCLIEIDRWIDGLMIDIAIDLSIRPSIYRLKQDRERQTDS